jgi:hypothetical protein
VRQEAVVTVLPEATRYFLLLLLQVADTERHILGVLVEMAALVVVRDKEEQQEVQELLDKVLQAGQIIPMCLVAAAAVLAP